MSRWDATVSCACDGTSPASAQAAAVVAFAMTPHGGLPTQQAGALVLRGDASMDLTNDGSFEVGVAT